MVTWYIAADGDDIGRRLEYFTLTNNTEELSSFSARFGNGMQWFKKELESRLGAYIIFSGGDNLMASINSPDNPYVAIEQIRVLFKKKGDGTLSVGIGQTPRDAYFALKIAKASGKNCAQVFSNI
jgi:GTP cyclohydrolase III